MSENTIQVKIRFPTGEYEHASFDLHDEAISDPNNVQLDISFLSRRETAIAPDYFEALTMLRKKFEPEGLLIVCNGSVENVYPSAMARSMGGGLKAYRLTMGTPAKTADLVSIFDATLNSPPASVEQQEAFYQTWLLSLGKSQS